MRLGTWLVLLMMLGCAQRSTSTHPDASGVTFACGTASCDPHTQFCYQFFAGAAPGVGCNPLPATCNGVASCACVTAAIPPAECGGAQSCSEDGGGVHLSCTGP